MCQEEEPHGHEPTRKWERQQKESRAVMEMAFLPTIPCLVSSESHCSEDFPACQRVVSGQETLGTKIDLLSFLSDMNATD